MLVADYQLLARALSGEIVMAETVVAQRKKIPNLVLAFFAMGGAILGGWLTGASRAEVFIMYIVLYGFMVQANERAAV